MNKNYGFVTFYKNEEIKEKDTLKGNYIVYPNIEDSLRFFGLEDDYVITKVSFIEYEDLKSSEYYGYFNMKQSKEITIEKMYSYEEIISIMTSGKVNEVKLCRFIDKFKVEEEYKNNFKKLGCFIAQYLENVQGEKKKTMVKKYGQNSNKGC